MTRRCRLSTPSLATLTAVVAVLLVVGASAATAGTTTVVALSGDAVPGGNGTFADFILGEDDRTYPGPLGAPTINDAGQIAFGAFLAGTAGGETDDSGLYLLDGSTYVELAREGEVPADGDGHFNRFRNSDTPALDASGRTGFVAFLRHSASGEFFETAAYGIDSAGRQQLVRSGDQAPPAGSGDVIEDLLVSSVNDAGQVAVLGEVIDVDPLGERVIYRADIASGELTRIVREHDPVPDGTASYDLIAGSAINDAGQIAFGSSLYSQTFDDRGVFRSDGTTTVEIARKWHPVPGSADETFSSFHPVDLSESGEVVFGALLTDSYDQEPNSGEGIFIGDGIDQGVVARTGQAPPDGNGIYVSFKNPVTLTILPDLNDRGQVAFYAQIGGAAGGAALGFFRADPGGEVTQIVRRGDPAPDGNGSFGLTYWPYQTQPMTGHAWINNRGQIAFFSNLYGTDSYPINDDVTGIFFHDDDHGLLQVAREGDELLGSPITLLSFLDRHGRAPDNNRSGLNDRGEVAYAFRLADGREGIAVWSAWETMFADGFESGDAGAWTAP